ncbi:MAG: type II secretion system protein, partial [Candidatus Scatovivens sp.]
KSKKGITLVALIITIIVMLILAGIIIASAVADGGVIDRTQQAMKGKERAEVEEITMSGYVYNTTEPIANEKIVLDMEQTADAIYQNLTLNKFTLISNIGDGEAKSGVDILNEDKDEIDLTVIGKYGEYSGKINKNGLIGKIKIGSMYGTYKTKYSFQLGEYNFNYDINYYIFKCGITIIKIDSGDGYTLEQFCCTEFSTDENNKDIILDKKGGTLLVKNFAEDFSSCECSPMEGFLTFKKTQEIYSYNPEKNENLGIYINAFYKSEDSIIYINDTDKKIIMGRTDNDHTISYAIQENSINAEGHTIEITEDKGINLDGTTYKYVSQLK